MTTCSHVADLSDGENQEAGDDGEISGCSTPERTVQKPEKGKRQRNSQKFVDS